jgi:hypothetical protein
MTISADKICEIIDRALAPSSKDLPTKWRADEMERRAITKLGKADVEKILQSSGIPDPCTHGKDIKRKLKVLEIAMDCTDEPSPTPTAAKPSRPAVTPKKSEPATAFTASEAARIARVVFRLDPSAWGDSESALSQKCLAQLISSGLKCPQTAGMELPTTKLTGMQQARQAVLQDRLNQALGIHPPRYRN